MKLIQKLKIWKELRRLEQRVREAPSPSSFVDLGQVYINLGMHERTLEIAEEGLALFPTSDELRKLRRYAKKNQLNGRIKDLTMRLAKAPHAKLYRELAGLYLELGDFDAVRETCEECLRRFPDDDGARLVLGKAKLTSFYRDLDAESGIGAVEELQHVIALDPGNVRAHRLLGEVLYRVGAMEQAIHHLEILRDLGPTTPEVDSMYDDAVRTGHATPRGPGGVEVLFQDVESRGVLPNAPPPLRARVRSSKPVASDDGIGTIRDSLAQIAEFAGVRKAAYIKNGRALVKGEIRDGKDSFLRVARVVAKASQRTARRLDIGNFSKGVVDVGNEHICLCCYGDVVAAVQCDLGTPTDRILTDLQELVAGSLYLTGNTP